MAVQEFYFFGSYNAFRPFKIKVFSGADSKFTIPTFGTGYNYRAKVAGVVDISGLTGNYTINFPSANTDYILEISGLFPQWYQNNNAEILKVRGVLQYGDVLFRSFLFFFYGCYQIDNSIVSIDSPKTIANIQLGGAFVQSNWNQPFLGFTTNGFFNIASTFQENNSFNQDVSSLDMSGCNNIQQVFDRSPAMSYAIDWSSPITGTINCTNDIRAFENVKTPSIKMQQGALTTTSNLAYNSIFITELILIDRSISLWIYLTGLTGTAIDNLANSVKDMTGLTSPTVTMTTAQKASCDITLWANRNWTIATV